MQESKRLGLMHARDRARTAQHFLRGQSLRRPQGLIRLTVMHTLHDFTCILLDVYYLNTSIVRRVQLQSDSFRVHRLVQVVQLQTA